MLLGGNVVLGMDYVMVWMIWLLYAGVECMIIGYSKCVVVW